VTDDRTTFDGAAERVIAVAVPWAFVALFAVLYGRLLFPRFGDNLLLTVLVAFAGLALISSVAAAVTLTRDVLAGRPV
jgi:predicted anti-sigma-YlaC factor YlaD